MDDTPAPRRVWQIHLLTALLMMIQAALAARLLVEAAYSDHCLFISLIESVLFISICAAGVELVFRRINWNGHRVFLVSLVSLTCAGLVFDQSTKSVRNVHMRINEKAARIRCKTFAVAEELFHTTAYSGGGVLSYSPRLYEPGNPNSLLGQGFIDQRFANAEIKPGPEIPRDGYLYKVLTKQGKNATGGVRDYISADHGLLTLGYAFIAFPAEYSVTGVNSYIINNNGTIFAKDLGPNTRQLASDMTEFDPDRSWNPVP